MLVFTGSMKNYSYFYGYINDLIEVIGVDAGDPKFDADTLFAINDYLGGV